MKKNKMLIIIILLVVILFATGILYSKHIEDNKINKYLNNQITALDKKKEEYIKIYNGEDRPIAVMIDNVGSARPQVGLNDAYIVYEIIVEGEQTRLMALFKGKNLDEIGPIRSSRHYFLDYVLENDAIYVHYGWSPKAKLDISSLNINNVNGMVQSSKTFWRVKDKSTPHNVVTSTDKILEVAKREKYRTYSSKESVLKYTNEDINLEEGINAINVELPYSNIYSVTYKYDEETKRYTRYYNDKKNRKKSKKRIKRKRKEIKS